VYASPVPIIEIVFKRPQANIMIMIPCGIERTPVDISTMMRQNYMAGNMSAWLHEIPKVI
jgi:hypothetical protein